MKVEELLELLRMEDPRADVKVADRSGEYDLPEAPDVVDVWTEDSVVFIEAE